MKRRGEVRRVITRLVHGGHAIVDSAPNRAEAAAAGAIRLSEVVQEPALADADAKQELEIVGVTDFDYLFRDTVADPANGCRPRTRPRSPPRWRRSTRSATR